MDKMIFTHGEYTNVFNERTGVWECTNHEELDPLTTVEILMWIVANSTEMPYYEREQLRKELKNRIKE